MDLYQQMNITNPNLHSESLWFKWMIILFFVTSSGRRSSIGYKGTLFDNNNLKFGNGLQKWKAEQFKFTRRESGRTREQIMAQKSRRFLYGICFTNRLRHFTSTWGIAEKKTPQRELYVAVWLVYADQSGSGRGATSCFIVM